MSYLVYCPTCDGKMSVNAETCPHCGENCFFERIPKKEERECDYRHPQSDFKCYTGYIYKECCRVKDVHLANRDFLFASCVNPADYIITQDICVHIGKSPEGDRIRQAILRNDYTTRSTDPWHPRSPTGLYLYRQVCPQCKGTGKMLADAPSCECDYKDIRERV